MPCEGQQKYPREHQADEDSLAQNSLAVWLLAPHLSKSWYSKLRVNIWPDFAAKTCLMGLLHFPHKGNPPLFISSLVLQIQAEYF